MTAQPSTNPLTGVEFPLTFSEGPFARLRTNLTIQECLQWPTQKWVDYGQAVAKLRLAWKEANLTPDELTLRKRQKVVQRGLVVTAALGVLGAVSAQQMNALFPNPAFFPNATLEQALVALSVHDDADTDVLPMADGYVIVEKANEPGHEVPVFVLTFTESVGGLLVLIKRSAGTEASPTAISLKGEARSLFDQVLLGKTDEAMQSVLTGVNSFATSLGDFLPVSAEFLTTNVTAAKWWKIITDTLIDSLGNPTSVNAQPGGFDLKKFLNF